MTDVRTTIRRCGNNVGSLRKGGQDGTYAYYSPWARSIRMNFKHEMEQAVKGGYGKFDTFAHEFGHHVDNMMGLPSASKEFLSAIQADKEMILRDYAPDLAVVRDRRQYSELRDDLINVYGDASKGVQDAMEGLGIARFRWGHGEAYWNRSDREKEVASELFANMSGATMNADEMEVMQKYFPNTVEQFKKIIAEGAKK